MEIVFKNFGFFLRIKDSQIPSGLIILRCEFLTVTKVFGSQSSVVLFCFRILKIGLSLNP